MTTGILSAATIDRRLQEAVSATGAERRNLVEQIASSYETKLTALRNRFSARAFASARLLSGSEYALALESKLAQGSTVNRTEAIAELATAYRRLFEVERKLAHARRGAPGGRSGTLATSSNSAERNTRWSAFLGSERLKDIGVLAPKYTETDDEDGWQFEPPPAPCQPIRYRVSTDKPPPERGGNSGAAQLTPGFLAYLRRTGQLHLSSLDDWREVNEVPDDAGSRQAYAKALATAERAYEAERWERRYCEVSDVPMPGAHRGHRLLKLAVPIARDDFRDNGCEERIYQGPSGSLAPPDVDYDELVRRYVQNLTTAMRYVYDLERLDPAAIRQFAEQEVAVYGQRVLERFVAASELTVQHAQFVERVSSYAQAGAVGFGPPPESLGEWLRSEDAETLRASIIGAWGLADEDNTGPGATDTLMSSRAFLSQVVELCLPHNLTDVAYTTLGDIYDAQPGGVYLDYTFASHQTPDWQTEAQKLCDHVTGLVADLAAVYDGIWRKARVNLGTVGLWEDRGAIELSGYEMRAYLHVLAGHALQASELYGSIKQIAIQKLKEAVADQPINFDTIDSFVGTQVQTTVGEPIRFNLQDNSKASWTAITGSYKNSLDAVLSFMGAETTSQAPTEQVGETEAQRLYETWTGFFVRFVEANVHGQSTLPDNFLVLRLAPRTGRYGEVPQRAPTDRFQPPTERSLSPRHPKRLTESYELEPLPDKYFWFDTPTVYLREDYSFSVQHRAFGIGANLYSLSLLPEEERTIVMKSVKDTKTMVSESTAENILEEAGSETESDFAQEVSRESERETSSQESGEVTAKASASWGFGSAEVSGSYSAQSASRSMAKNVSNVSDRLSNKLSAKRKVSIDTKRSEDTSIEMHEEVNTERTIRNPNKGHTITFNWYQITRKLATQLHLDELNLVYTSGKHNTVRAFVKGDIPALDDTSKSAMLQAVATEMPADVARLMPPQSVILVVTDPYTEVVPMAAANAFLARILSGPKAAEISSTVWQVVGLGPAAPEGLNVAAYSGERKPAQWAAYTPLFSDQPDQCTDGTDAAHVVADRLNVEQAGGETPADEIYLPNVDLRFRSDDDLPPTRYQGGAHEADVLPRLLMSKEQVVNTNGVYCDAMLGRCSALEDYLQRHRDLDLLDKRIEVGAKELEFKWALARDDMVEVSMDADGKILGTVKEKEHDKGFEQRLAVEDARRLELQQGYTEAYESQRKEEELNLLRQQVAKLAREVKLLGKPSKYVFDVPGSADVGVQVNVDADGGHKNVRVSPATGDDGGGEPDDRR